MKFYKNGLVYDTEKSQLVAQTGIYSSGYLYHYAGERREDCYRTENGRFFTITYWYQLQRKWFSKPFLVPDGEPRFSTISLTDLVAGLHSRGLIMEATALEAEMEQA